MDGQSMSQWASSDGSSLQSAGCPQSQTTSLQVDISDTTLHIAIPASVCGGGAAAVFAGLHKLLGLTPPNYDWLVDLSSVRQPTLALISVLISLRSYLQEQGGRMLVTGLRSDAFSTAMQRTILEVLPVEPKGAASTSLATRH